MATIPKAAKERQLQHGQLGLFGVIMPGVAQVAPAFNLFFTTGLMVSLAGASAPLIFLISMVGMVATASSLAQFASIYPSAGSFITYITRAIGTKVAVAVGVITILGYIIAFGGIYIFVGSYIAQNVAAAPLAEETQNPRRNVPIAVIGAVIISGIIYVVGSFALVIAFGVGHTSTLAADPNPFHTAAKAFIPFVAPLITWIFLSSVTSSYVAANTQTSRVIFAGARGGLWSRSLAGVSPRFRTPAAAAVAFVAPSIAIGVISTAFTSPATASGFLSTYGILGLVIMYLAANVALVVEWARLRRRGVRKNPWLWVVVPVIGVAG